jgi:hypothetical protein
MCILVDLGKEIKWKGLPWKRERESTQGRLGRKGEETKERDGYDNYGAERLEVNYGGERWYRTTKEGKDG